MPASDHQPSEHDDKLSHPSASDRRHQRGERMDDPYRQVRRRLDERARQGEKPFAGWLGDDLPEDRAWWELPPEPPLLPDASNWRPGTIVGHLVPAERRAISRPTSSGFGLLIEREIGPQSNRLEQLSPAHDLAFEDDEAFQRDAQSLFDDWADEQQRRPKKSRRSGKRSRRDSDDWEQSR